MAILIALSFLVAACQSQSLPSRSAEDKTSTAGAGPLAVESAPAQDANITKSEERALAALSERAAAEIEQTRLVDITEVKVGLLLPLSGPLAREGAALLDAAQLALFDVADAHFILQPSDTGGTADGAVRAAEALLADGATLLLGPLLSEEVRAVTPIARAAGVNVVAFSTDAEVAGDGIYLLGHTSRQQIDRLVGFAYDSGLMRIAVLAPSTPYGRAVAGQTRRAVAAVGGDVTGIAFYAPDASDANEVVRGLANYDRRHGDLVAQRDALSQRDDEISKRALRRLEGLDTLGDVPFDALLLPDGGESLRQVVPLLPYYDIDPAKVRFLGTGLWDNSETLGEPTLVGGWYVGPPPGARVGFIGRFVDTFGYTPHRIAALAYDATALAAALARRAGRAAFDSDSLASPRGFLGAGGIFRFSAEGLPERGLAVLEITGRNEVVVVSPPPERFAVSKVE
ncbi:MAG: penicillin-binding protein activator [Proteobacteria bacterium]|nr:penicillin-binding protein activator [Pseudomonadota bacterium]MDA1356233.1 penicillin-binding protein activator [Pseudomonadota bacterium]